MNTKKIINLGSTDFDFNLFVISIQCVKQKDSVLFLFRNGRVSW